jgi:ubiquitin-like 1-activating enzyme E1 A
MSTILPAEYSLTSLFNSDCSALKDHPKNVKATAVYTPLTSAISYRWNNFTKRQTKEINPALYFAILGG